MNKIYKTVWNAVRQQFVVADEAQNTRGKPAKAAVALTVVAAALCSTMASAAYVEPGFVANSRLQMDEAKASWETDEYMRTGASWHRKHPLLMRSAFMARASKSA